jgi:prefoldin subunit 5
MATQPENGNAAPGVPHESSGPAKSAVQKRIDKITREKHELESALQRALQIIERYKAALKAARGAHG